MRRKGTNEALTALMIGTVDLHTRMTICNDPLILQHMETHCGCRHDLFAIHELRY